MSASSEIDLLVEGDVLQEANDVTVKVSVSPFITHDVAVDWEKLELANREQVLEITSSFER